MFIKLMNKFRGSLNVKIFFITASILMAVSLTTYLFLVWATPISYDNIVEDNEHARVTKLAEELSLVTMEESGDIIDRFKMENGVEITIMDDHGNKIVVSPTERDKQGQKVYTVVEGPADGLFISTSLSVSTQFIFRESDEVYKLISMSLTAPVNHTAEAMRGVFPFLTAMILLVSFLGALFYSRYITRPIVRLSSLSQKMTGLDFTCHSGETRADEIGVLGRNLDELSNSLSACLEQLRMSNDKLKSDIDAGREMEKRRAEFFAAVSHELKTPLTILSGQLSGMFEGVGIYQDHDKYLPRSLSVVRRMEKLVGELLLISRMDQNAGETPNEIIKLSELVENQIEDIKELAQLRAQKIEFVIAPDIKITGDKELIQKAISNLIGNAATHSPEHAKITVLLEGKKLVIINTGAYIPPESLPRLFEPLYRVDCSRNSKTGGGGMGLYLVKMILDRHGAVCMINNTDNGVETVVEF